MVLRGSTPPVFIGLKSRCQTDVHKIATKVGKEIIAQKKIKRFTKSSLQPEIN